MITFSEIPAIPGSVRPSPGLLKILASENPAKIETSGRHLGATLLLNVEPPTPARTVEVALSLFDATQDVVFTDKVAFMKGILEGAMQQADREAATGERPA